MASLDLPGSSGVATPPQHHLPDFSRIARLALRFGLPILVLLALLIVGLRYRSAHEASPIRYETVRVDRGPLAAKVTATGTLAALVMVNVGSQVSGRIETLYVDFGSTVTKGMVVARIEPSFFKAAVDQARANANAAAASTEKARAQLDQAQKQYARAKVLLGEGLMGRADFDSAEAALAVAKADIKSSQAAVGQANAALSQAELNLKYTTILSPIDGVVISRNVDVGQTVAATLQAPVLFTIAQDLTRMAVDTNVAEADVGKVKAGMNVTFTVDAYPGRTFPGVVRQVRDNALTVQNVVTYDAVIDVDNSEKLLKPGMAANVTFGHATRADVLRLPNAALRFKPDPPTLSAMTKIDTRAALPKREIAKDERVVWVLRGGRAESAIARIGITDGSSTEVIGGDVQTGDEVVAEANLPRS